MSPRYSRYRSKFYIDPDHEKQATALVNSMGGEYILEGAINIGAGDLRVWWKNSKTNLFNCRVIPIIFDFDANVQAPVSILIDKEIKEETIEEKDLATDENFLIEKK